MFPTPISPRLALVCLAMTAAAASLAALPAGDPPPPPDVEYEVRASAPRGTEFLPVPTWEEFFEALDSDFPDPRIGEIRATGLSGDIESALAAYLDYRRVLAPPHPLRDFAAEESDAALMARSAAISNALLEENRLVPIFEGWFEGQIQRPFDWAILEAEHPTTWAYAHRVYFWNDLGRAWRQTGDVRFAELYFESALPWLDLYRPQPPIWPPDLEPPYPIGWGQYPYNDPVYSPILVGIRLQDAFTSSIAYFLESDEMTPERHGRLVRSVLEQARQAMLYDTVTYNWQAIEASGLMMAGTLYPEFSEAAAWRAEAVRRVNDTVASQFMPDGMQHELVPHYHAVVLRNLWLIHEVGQIYESGADWSDLLGVLEDGIDLNMGLQRPDRTEPMYGDGVGVLPMREGFHPDEWRDSGGLTTGLAYFDRPDWQQFASGGPITVPRDFFSPASGYLALRTGWAEEDVYVGFDVGPLGYNHYNEDALHVIYEAAGRRWLIDSGRGAPYESSARRNAYYLHSSGHNTALPDGGRGQARARLLARPDWTSPAGAPERTVLANRPRYAYARGRYDFGYGPRADGTGAANLTGAAHERMLLFERRTGALWAIDWMQSPDPLPWEILWHWDANNVAPSPSGAAGLGAESAAVRVETFLVERSGGLPADRLVALMAAPTALSVQSSVVEGQESPRYQGWTQDDWAPPRPIPTLVRALGADAAPWHAALLLPPGEDGADLSLAWPLVPTETLRALTMDRRNGRERLLAVFNPDRADLAVDALETDGEAAFVWQLSLAGETDGPLLAWAVVEGTYLRFGGQTLVDEPARVSRDESGGLFFSTY